MWANRIAVGEFIEALRGSADEIRQGKVWYHYKTVHEPVFHTGGVIVLDGMVHVDVENSGDWVSIPFSRLFQIEWLPAA